MTTGASVPPEVRVRTRAYEATGVDAEFGRQARRRAPRRAAGDWDASVRSVTALDRLRAQESVRDAGLLPLRYARMASSPWAYLRGAAAVMAGLGVLTAFRSDRSDVRRCAHPQLRSVGVARAAVALRRPGLR
ncbi:hypothetical protein GOHSU_30_00065 [Gordonia hirsuta DSM 44140 = NBRC 16056]|uniref:Uncharacterized protein n=1 Tax=Gordonia hirsuta DSM 44140 = NBRC 16056 TaxID=1121927 RepID=L7LDE6_9ACTN|nr:hypothetical protein GOHSU_30_00065 [Gordonia hirsuta DSM 44140 = NBRC 16056]